MDGSTSSGLEGAGGLIKAAGSYEAGRYAKKAAYAQARAAQQDGADQEVMIRERARAAIGAQIGAQAASGFQIGTGSALDAVHESQVNATLDVLQLRRKAAADAMQLRNQGRVAYARGYNQMVSGLIQTAAQAASAGAGGGAGGAAVGSGDWAGGGYSGALPPASGSISVANGYVPGG